MVSNNHDQEMHASQIQVGDHYYLRQPNNVYIAFLVIWMNMIPMFILP